MGFAREKLCWSILFGTRGKISDFRGRSPRYGCGGYFIQTRNRRSSENGHNGFAWLQSVFSDDLGNEWKSSVGFAREKYIGLFCFGRWAKYPIFVGGAHATVATGIVFKLAIEGRLKTVITGLPSRNPCFQTTSMMMGRGSVSIAREKYVGQFCLGQGAKYPIFVGEAHATVEVRFLCKFII